MGIQGGISDAPQGGTPSDLPCTGWGVESTFKDVQQQCMMMDRVVAFKGC